MLLIGLLTLIPNLLTLTPFLSELDSSIDLTDTTCRHYSLTFNLMGATIQGKIIRLQWLACSSI